MFPCVRSTLTHQQLLEELNSTIPTFPRSPPDEEISEKLGFRFYLFFLAVFQETGGFQWLMAAIFEILEPSPTNQYPNVAPILQFFILCTYSLWCWLQKLLEERYMYVFIYPLHWRQDLLASHNSLKIVVYSCNLFYFIIFFSIVWARAAVSLRKRRPDSYSRRRPTRPRSASEALQRRCLLNRRWRWAIESVITAVTYSTFLCATSAGCRRWAEWWSRRWRWDSSRRRGRDRGPCRRRWRRLRPTTRPSRLEVSSCPGSTWNRLLATARCLPSLPGCRGLTTPYKVSDEVKFSLLCIVVKILDHGYEDGRYSTSTSHFQTHFGPLSPSPAVQFTSASLHQSSVST